MKNKFILMLMLLAATVAQAQKYIIDSPYRSCAKATDYRPSTDIMDHLFSFMQDHEDPVYIDNGTEVEMLDRWSSFSKIIYDSKELYVKSICLRFSENNPASAVDSLAIAGLSPMSYYLTHIDIVDEAGNVIQSDTDVAVNTIEIRGTEWNLLTSKVLLVGICIISIVLLVLSITSTKDLGSTSIVTPVAHILRFLSPVLLLAMLAFQAYGFWRLGTDFYWFCNIENFSTWAAIVLWVPLVVTIVAQRIAFNRYQEIVEVVHDTYFHGWATVVSVVLSIAAVVGAFAIVAYNFAGIDNFDEARTYTMDETYYYARLILIFFVVLSLIFPIIYYCVRMRSIVGGILFAIIKWMFTMLWLVSLVLLISATWQIIAYVVLPIIGAAAMFIFLMSWKTKEKKVTYIDPQTGRMQTRTESTLEFDPNWRK